MTQPPILDRLARANPAGLDEELGNTAHARAALERILSTPAADLPRHPARRHSRRTLVLCLAVLLVMAAAALAATDPFHLFRSSAPDSALYGVDDSRTVATPTATEIGCSTPAATALRCAAALAGQRYLLAGPVQRSDAQGLTRANLVRVLHQQLARGAVSPAAARRFEDDLAAVSDTFLARLREVLRYGTISGGLGFAGHRVPPPGVPAFIVCDYAGSGLSCRDLNGDGNAAVGSGIYMAIPNRSWRAAPAAGVRDTSG